MLHQNDSISAISESAISIAKAASHPTNADFSNHLKFPNKLGLKSNVTDNHGAPRAARDNDVIQEHIDEIFYE